MAELEVLRSMVKSFRLLELQSLMLFAGKSKLGRKSELQVSHVTCRSIMYNMQMQSFQIKVRNTYLVSKYVGTYFYLRNGVLY